MHIKPIFSILFILITIVITFLCVKRLYSKGGCITFIYTGLIVFSINFFFAFLSLISYNVIKDFYIILSSTERNYDSNFLIKLGIILLFYFIFSILFVGQILFALNRVMENYYSFLKKIAFYFFFPLLMIIFDILLIYAFFYSNEDSIIILILLAFFILMLSLGIVSYFKLIILNKK